MHFKILVINILTFNQGGSTISGVYTPSADMKQRLPENGRRGQDLFAMNIHDAIGHIE